MGTQLVHTVVHCLTETAFSFTDGGKGFLFACLKRRCHKICLVLNMGTQLVHTVVHCLGKTFFSFIDGTAQFLTERLQFLRHIRHFAFECSAALSLLILQKLLKLLDR